MSCRNLNTQTCRRLVVWGGLVAVCLFLFSANVEANQYPSGTPPDVASNSAKDSDDGGWGDINKVSLFRDVRIFLLNAHTWFQILHVRLAGKHQDNRSGGGQNQQPNGIRETNAGRGVGPQ